MSNQSNALILSELVIEFLEGTISRKEFARLDRMIVQDGGAVDMFLDFIAIHMILSQQEGEYEISAIQTTTLFAEPGIEILEGLAESEKNGKAVEVERAEEEKILTEEEREAKIRAFIREQKAMEEQERRLEEEARRKIWEREQRQRQRIEKARRVAAKVWKYPRIGAMAAVGMIIAYFLYALLMPVPPASVATLTNGVNVKWANPDLPVELDSLLRPGSMKLVEGYAEITFDEGASLIIEAHCEIELQDTHKAFLKVGKLTAHVPLEARGFKLNTPSVSIIDLGTEFGVHVKEDGSSDIHVFKGKVSLLAGKLGEMIDKLYDTVEQTVKASQAKRVLAGSTKIQDIQFGRARFVRNMPSPYELAIRKGKPDIYWQFNQDSKYIDGLQYFGNAKIKTIGPDLGDGKPNNALKLDGQNEYVLVKDKTQNWAQTGFTLVLWVQPDAIARQNIIVNADQDGPHSNYSRQLFVNSEGKFVFWILVWEPDLPEDYYPVTLTSSTVAQPGRWYHVAVTVGADDGIRMFVNGSEGNKLSLDNQVFDFKPERNHIYIGSAACGVLDDRKPMDSFTGGLDEIARYNRVLSPKEIRQLYMSAGQ